MKLNIEGTKYTICFDDKGGTWINRNGKPWCLEPDAAKAWRSVAYELYCLRRIAKLFITLAGDTPEMAKLLAELDGYTDFRRNLDDPGSLHER